jgi:type I restriction enzyme S subunit
MTGAAFVEHALALAERSGRIPAIRAMVVDLATTGRLTAPNEADGSGVALLQQIASQRQRLLGAGKIRQRSGGPVAPNERPFHAPAHWAWCRLSDVGYELGQTVPTETFTYIDVGGIDADRGVISDRVEVVAPQDAPSRARKLVQPGTVIYSTVRPYLLNIAIVEREYAHPPIASTAFGILHPFDGVDQRYLFYWLRSRHFTAYVRAAMKGMAYPAINDDKFYSGPIALPPLAEQKRIVVKVDELMALCDRLEAQLKQRDEQAGVLAKAAVARFQADPSVENLEYLFHQAFVTPPADIRNSTLTLATSGVLAQDCWAEVRFGDVVKLLGGYAFKSEWFATTNGVRLVRNQNVSHGRLDWSDTEYLPQDRAHEFEKWALRPGDLVLSLNRPFISTGLKLAWIKKEDCPCLLVQRVVCMRPDPERLLAEYLYLWCNAPEFLQNAHVVPSSGVPYIVPNRVANMTMRLPPIAEQRRIVAKVNELMALVDQLESQITASEETGTKLLDALVAELAPSD